MLGGISFYYTTQIFVKLLIFLVIFHFCSILQLQFPYFCLSHFAPATKDIETLQQVMYYPVTMETIKIQFINFCNLRRRDHDLTMPSLGFIMFMVFKL